MDKDNYLQTSQVQTERENEFVFVLKHKHRGDTVIGPAFRNGHLPNHWLSNTMKGNQS